MMKLDITPEGIVSDAGFTISRLDERSVRYIAPTLSLTLPVINSSDRELRLGLHCLHHWDEHEPLTEADKARLMAFIAAAYDHVGIKVVFE